MRSSLCSYASLLLQLITPSSINDEKIFHVLILFFDQASFLITIFLVFLFSCFLVFFRSKDDFKKFREAAFEELEFIMNSEMKLNSTREALDIMYQPHDDLFGESDDDDNFFLYLDDKEASFYSIQSTSYSNSNINMNNNNDNENCQNYNDNYYEVIDSIQSKNNDYNISFCPLKKKNVHNNNSTVCKSADVKDFSHTNSITNENRNKNKNHSYKTDLFGMKNSVENEIIFDRTRTVQNPTSVSVCTSLNIPGINQIAKSDEKKRDDEKCKGKEKEKDMLPYDTTALTATAHIHPLAYICV